VGAEVEDETAVLPVPTTVQAVDSVVGGFVLVAEPAQVVLEAHMLVVVVRVVPEVE
jgi:hypothetical protein